jgi:hypothetical protein
VECHAQVWITAPGGPIVSIKRHPFALRKLDSQFLFNCSLAICIQQWNLVPEKNMK